jgi:phage shock protein PspC (stress-responsive transcriptional regulator)
MGIADELERLQALRTAGALSDAEFERAKARVLDAGVLPSAVARLRRSRSDRWLAGVCGGVAALTGVDAWVWRLLLVLLACFGGTGILLYILLWILVPDEAAAH